MKLFEGVERLLNCRKEINLMLEAPAGVMITGENRSIKICDF